MAEAPRIIIRSKAEWLATLGALVEFRWDHGVQHRDAADLLLKLRTEDPIDLDKLNDAIESELELQQDDEEMRDQFQQAATAFAQEGRKK